MSEPAVATTRARSLAASAPWVVAFVASTVATLLLYRHSQGRIGDDAFIFYRYARNLATGHGWQYDLRRSTTNGATSPLWTVILAVAYRVRADMAANSDLLCAASLAGAGLYSFATLRHLGRPVAGVGAAVLIAINPTFLWVRGMESSVFVLVACATLYYGMVSRRLWAFGVACGLIMLVRPEGVILAVLVGAYRWREDRRPPWTAVLWAAIVVLPWFLYSVITFGSPLAGTLEAKTAQGRSGFFGPSFVFFRYGHTVAQHPWSLALVLGAAVGIVLGLLSPVLRPFTMIVAGFVALHAALYGLLIRPPAYLWYYVPEYLGAVLLTAVAADEACRLVLDRFAPDARQLARAVPVALLLLAVAATSISGQTKGDIYPGYRETTAWLRGHAARGSTVACAEIGVIGDGGSWDMVDYLGLLSADSVRELNRGDLRSWLRRERPTYYVVHVPVWPIEAPSASSPEFTEHYKPVAESRSQGWSHVRIYERTSKPEGTRFLTPIVVGAFDRAGVALDAGERSSLNRLLAIYAGDVELQARFEGPTGVVFDDLVTWSVQHPVGLRPADRAVLRTLAKRMEGHEVTSPLVAPT
jgi:hypothetical protein